MKVKNLTWSQIIGAKIASLIPNIPTIRKKKITETTAKLHESSRPLNGSPSPFGDSPEKKAINSTSDEIEMANKGLHDIGEKVVTESSSEEYPADIDSTNFTTRYTGQKLVSVNETIMAVKGKIYEGLHHLIEADKAYKNSIIYEAPLDKKPTQEEEDAAQNAHDWAVIDKAMDYDILSNGYLLNNQLSAFKNGKIPTQEEEKQLKRISEGLKEKYGQFDARRTSNKIQREIVVPKMEASAFFEEPLLNKKEPTQRTIPLPVHETKEKQDIFQNATEQTLKSLDRPEFWEQLQRIKLILETIQKSLQKEIITNKLAQFTKPALRALIMTILVLMGLDATVWYFVGTVILGWGIFKSCIIALTSLGIAKVLGEVFFKPPLEKSLKYNVEFIFKGKKLFSVLCLVTVLSAGAAVFTALEVPKLGRAVRHLELEEKRNKKTPIDELLLNDGFNRNTAKSTVQVKLETTKSRLNFWLRVQTFANFFSVTFLGLIALICSSYQFAKYQIIAPIVHKRRAVNEQLKKSTALVAKMETLVKGREDFVYQAAYISGLVAVLQLKYQDYDK